MWKRSDGAIGTTFAGFHVWANDRRSFLIDEEHFWEIAELLCGTRRRKLFAEAQGQLRGVMGEVVTSSRRYAVERDLYRLVASHLARATEQQIDALGIVPEWEFQIEGDDRTWMAALDWFAARRPDFTYYRAIHPKKGVVLALARSRFSALYPTAFDESSAALVEDGDVQLVRAQAGRVQIVCGGGQVLLDAKEGLLTRESH